VSTAEHPFGELIAEYVAECLPLAEDVADRAVALERAWRGGTDAEGLQQPLKGLLHTIKGNSAMMGLTAAQHLAHALEDLNGRLATAPAARADGAELFVRGAGLLVDLIRTSATGEATDDPAALVTEVRDFLAATDALPAEPAQPERRAGDRRQGDHRGTRALGEVGADGAVTTIRVDSARLDALLEAFGEAMIAQAGLREAVRQVQRRSDPELAEAALEHATLALGRTLKQLESALMATRLLPISTVFGRFTRLVRDLAKHEGREVRLEVAGGDTRLDKTVIDRLGEPLVHLITNAIVHGLEPPAERVKAGKPAEAVITLHAVQRSDRVVLTVHDDGRGLDPERILRKARALGVAPVRERASDAEIFALAFLPGLSTADKVSNLAGRGVGLDVVASSIRALGGQVSVASTPGKGTTFTLRLPLTVAVMRSLLVTIDGERYALPLGEVQETVRVHPEAMHEVGGRGLLPWRDQVLPVTDGGEALGGVRPATSRRYCVVLRGAAQLRGLLVDGLDGHQEIVVKALDPSLGRPPAVAGTTILGDGRVACILDTARLLEGAGEPAGALAGKES